MRTVRLGKTELWVSEVGFGGIPIIPLDFQEGVGIVRQCYELGISFFDTANMYGDSEKKIGFYHSPRPLTEQDNQEIEKMRSELGKRFCHRCGYCMPCEQGVKIPEVMSFRSIARRLAPAVTIAFTKDAVGTVDKCSDCGECLQKCPYNLPIPDLIKEYRSVFNDYVSKHG